MMLLRKVLNKYFLFLVKSCIHPSGFDWTMNTTEENNTSLLAIVSKLKEKENKKRKSSEGEPINIFLSNDEKTVLEPEVVVSMEERRRRSQRQYNGSLKLNLFLLRN
jgi:hypothetical protein